MAGRDGWRLPRFEAINPKRALILAVVISVLALTLAVPMRSYLSTKSDLDAVHSSNAQLRSDNAKLEKKISEQHDPAYTEEQARNRLQFVKPGEKPYVMQYPTAPDKSDAQKRAEQQAKNPWYTNLWQSLSVPEQK